jgi:hypothetical protein
VELTHVESTSAGEKFAEIDFSRPKQPQLKAQPESPPAGPLSSEPTVRGVVATARANLPDTVQDEFSVHCTGALCIVHTRQPSNQAVAQVMQRLQAACDDHYESPCTVWLQAVETGLDGTGRLATIEVHEQ